MKCEREIDALALAMVWEGADLKEVLDTLREYWMSAWSDQRARVGKQFDAAQEGVRKA